MNAAQFSLQNTKTRALVEARALLQRFGFNGFSFQHVADAVGIKAPSLYAHFASKEQLGTALIAEYRAEFEKWTKIVAFMEPEAKLHGLFELFYSFSVDSSKYCPLTSFSGDLQTLPKALQKAVQDFFKLQRKWVQTVIEEGQKKKVFRRDLKSETLSHMVVALGFGAQTVSRLAQDAEKIREVTTTVLKLLKE